MLRSVTAAMTTFDLRLLEATDADIPRLFAILFMSFEHDHPFVEAVYPLHDESCGRLAGSERMLVTKNSDPNTTFLKVIDESINPAVGESAQVVGFAKWNVYDGFIPDEVELDGDHWDDADAKELAQFFAREFVQLRRRAIRASNGNLCCMCPVYSACCFLRLTISWLSTSCASTQCTDGGGQASCWSNGASTSQTS